LVPKRLNQDVFVHGWSSGGRTNGAGC
jgi:hypothetical protein